jgi:phage tail-like protein
MPTLELPTLVIRTVAAVTETARLLLVNRNPEPDETGVPLDSTIALELVDVGPAGIARNQTRVFVNGVLAFEGGGAPEFRAGFDGPRASVVVGSDSLRLVLDPVVPFVSLALVSVRVVSATMDGETLDASYQFHVEDRTAPRLMAAQATAQKTVRVGFDEAVLVPGRASFTLTPKAAPAVPLSVVVADADDSVVTLTFDIEMTPDIPYEVVAIGVTDRFGNAVMAPYDRAEFFGFRPAAPPTRRFDLWQMLPKHNRRDDVTGDLRRFVASLQEVTDLLLVDIDRWPEIFELDRAPEAFLDAILLDLGNPFTLDLSTLDRRKLAAMLVEMYRQKGTQKGIQNAVRFLLGIEIAAISQLNVTTLILGESELGVDWVLGPSDRFARYAFNVEVSRVLTEVERSRLRALVNYLRPAHTHFVELLEPSKPVASDLWVLGIGELGIATTLN